MSLTNWQPFVVHFKILPARPGRRFEYVRELQKIATYIYSGLSSNSSFQLAVPGGGQQRSTQFHNWLNYGGAVKPSIGNSPAQVMVSGWYDVISGEGTDYPQPTYPDTTIISDTTQTGEYGANPWVSNPTTAVDTEVTALILALKTSVAAAVPSQYHWSLFRLDYRGIVWGDRGRHFPYNS